MAIDRIDIASVRKISFSSFEDVTANLGAVVITPWFTMDPDRSEEFEHSTYLHDDPRPAAYTQDEGYGTGLVEGFHLLGMIDYLLKNAVEITGDLRLVPWNYGLDHVRFVSVVRHHDRFRLRGTLIGTEQKPTGIKVTFKLTAEVEGREEPAFIATQHALWVPLSVRTR